MILVLAAAAMASNPKSWWTPSTNAPPLPEAVFPGNGVSWKIAGGEFAVARDAKLGADVLTVTGTQYLVLDGQTHYGGGQEILARVRMQTGIGASSTAYFTFGRTNASDAAYYVTLGANKGYELITASVHQRGTPLHHNAELVKTMDWMPPWSSSFDFYLKAYRQILPGWEESYRAQIEEAMSRLPGLQEKWVDLRIQFRKGLVRSWLDDRLVATKEDAALDPQGTLKIQLVPGVQLASFRVEPFVETKGFHPIALAGYFNGRAFVDAKSLPPADKLVQVEGVPFIFPGANAEGNDHIDVGQSFLRQANQQGYLPSGPGQGGRWYGAAQRDPARIQLRLPNGYYDSLYLIAASDDQPNSVPLLSAMFYRPAAGFAETFEARVPFATANSSDAKALPVRLANGKKANLWLVNIPLDPARLTAFADLDIVEIELTKKVHRYRTYPDPINYGWHQGGPPSSVRIYAATLSESPLVFSWNPDRFGHVWTSPEMAGYTGTITNRSKIELSGKLTVTTRSYDGSEETKQEQGIKLPAGGAAQAKFSLPVKLNGYHDLVATLQLGDMTWTEKRSLVRLAPDTRSARWTEGKGAMFGYWSYHGWHHTPKADHHVRLMTMAGARQSEHLLTTTVSEETKAIMLKHWGKGQSTAYYVAGQPWAAETPNDPAKIEGLRKELLKAVETWEKDTPEPLKPACVNFFCESHISARLTAGNFPEYWNGEPFQYTDEEKQRLKMFFETARLAAGMVQKELPGRKVMIEWGDPGFVIPLLRAGFPTNLVDGSSLDAPGFERLPEMQLYDNVVHRMYELVTEYKKVGITKPELWYCEGAFVPTEPGAVSWREQMDIYNRWALINLAYGVTRFYSGWFAFDCGNYYGAEHYGGCGIQRRIPYCDPKPAYAAFATMTDKLNEANFDGWLKTGSLTTFCLRFKHETRGNIYALWTVRGTRPVTLTLKADAKAKVTDAMNNAKEFASKDKKITVTTDQSVIYITDAGEVVSAEVGTPDYSDAKPDVSAKLVADLGDGSWSYTSRRDTIYENNHWGFYPYAGKFSTSSDNDSQQGKVLVSKLEKQDVERQLMPWYNVLKPKKPIALPFAPSHIGLWVKGASDWGRMIYILRDAKGERWISIGDKDDYNCNDVHSWSAFNFDGWRYVRFELPGHTGWDNFRKHGTTWWRSDYGDTIVDLPLSIEEIIVEQRSHILYVNDVQRVASDKVAFGKIYVEYATPEDATPNAVRESKLRMPVPKEAPDLPNPIAELQRDGVGAPTKLIKLTAPEHYYDGTRMHVHFSEVPGAKSHHLWVSAHADGRGAVNMVPAGIKPGQLVTGLRPGIKLYYWITYVDANDKPSKPSPRHEEVTVDNFKEK